MPRRRSERARGSVLVLVLVLLIAVLAASAFAVWGLRSDTGAAGRDRLGRQLFDCAEQGLAWGKQYFTTTGSGRLNSYFAANVCASSRLPCPPFPASAPGPAVAGYPTGAPFTNQIRVDPANGSSLLLEYQVGVYNNAEVPASPFADTDSTFIVYSRCREPVGGQWRAVQGVVKLSSSSGDYVGQAGGGMRNQGNRNR